MPISTLGTTPLSEGYKALSAFLVTMIFAIPVAFIAGPMILIVTLPPLCLFVILSWPKPQGWKGWLVEVPLEGLVMLIVLAIVGYFGFAFFFQSNIKMPTDIYDVAKLYIGCLILSLTARYVIGKVNWPK